MLLAIALIISNKLVSDLLQQPLTSIAGLMFYPSILLFSASSIKVLIFSAVLCIGRSYYCSLQVYEVYKVAISEEQTNQIAVFLGISMIISPSISLMAIVQKLLERKVWSLAQENYNKSETLNKEMILAMEAKDRFISMVSHEIRNPLNTLKGSVEYLIQVENDPKHMKILKGAQLSGEILLNLVNNVLDAAKLKSDKMEIHRSGTSFVDVVKKVFMVNSELLKEKRLTARAYIDESLPPNIWIDPSRVLQVLLNLMSNAVKFTPKGGKVEVYAEWCSANENKENLLKPIRALRKDSHCQEASIFRRQEGDMSSGIREMESEELIQFTRKLEKISVLYETKQVCNPSFIEEYDPWELKITKVSSHKGPLRLERNSGHTGYLKVQIIDTGCGIAAEVIPKLFGMFEQATEHSRSAHGGSGLGLWICKQICQRMNGDITLYSEVNKGSSFVLYIPVQNSQRPRESEGIIPMNNGKLRALVVDNYQTNRYIHKLLLEQQGVQVALACDGKEALEKYKGQGNEPYSFILMDVHMPVMDGFTAAKRIREWEIEAGKKQTDIYFVTGEYFNEADVLMRFKSVGGSSSGMKYLNKPIGTEALKKIIILYK